MKEKVEGSLCSLIAAQDLKGNHLPLCKYFLHQMVCKATTPLTEMQILGVPTVGRHILLASLGKRF